MRLGRRYPFQPQLQGPVLINPMELPREDQRTIETVIPVRDQPQRRRPLSFLRKPQVVAVAVVLDQDRQTVKVRLVKARRPRAFSRLSPPATLQAGPQPPVVTKLLAALVDPPRPRQPKSKLQPPATLQQAQTPAPVETVIRIISAVLDRFSRRDAQQPQLGAPIVINPAAAQPPVETDVRVFFPVRTQTQRYRTEYKLLPPVVVSAAPQPPVVTALKLVIPQKRQHARYKTGWKLNPPAILASFPVVIGIYTTLAAIQTRAQYARRLPKSRLGRPPIVAVLTPPVVTKLLAVMVGGRTRAEAPRREPWYKLFSPAVIAPALLPPVVTDLMVALAYRTRLELARRAPHSVLSPPRVLLGFLPERIRVVAQAGASRLLRRGGKTRLQAPAKINPTPLPLLDQRTIRVVSWADRARDYRPKQAKSRVFPPVVVDLFAAITKYFNFPKPRGRSDTNPDSGKFDPPNPGGRV